MIRPRYMPSDAFFDDPATKIDPPPRDDSFAFALAGGGITRVHEWITRGRGGAKQRGLRSDLVTLCICPHLLPCKRPSASWCARQHGVSRQRASRLQQEFARELGANIQFRGMRFLNRANALKATGPGAAGRTGAAARPGRWRIAHAPNPPRCQQARRR
jgi:hypothetical protein